MYRIKAGADHEKVAITGAGYISQRVLKVEQFPSSFKPGVEAQKKIGELVSQDILKKYTGLSDYVKYGYLAAGKACQNKIIESPEQWGIYSGTGFGGSTEVYIKQCNTYYEKGLSWILPSMVMNKVAKTTADILSIEYQIKGKSHTVLAGRVSSGMALMQAYDDILSNEITHALAVGAESIDGYLSQAYTRMEYPAANLCSGGGALVLCRPEKAEVHSVYAYLNACECSSVYMNSINPASTEVLSEAIDAVIQKALYKANISISDIDGVIYAKTYNEKVDSSILNTIKKRFDKYESGLYCMTDYLGDMLGLNPLLTILTSLSIMKDCITLEDPKQFRNKKFFLGLVYGLGGQVCTFIIENAAP